MGSERDNVVKSSRTKGRVALASINEIPKKKKVHNSSKQVAAGSSNFLIIRFECVIST